MRTPRDRRRDRPQGEQRGPAAHPQHPQQQQQQGLCVPVYEDLAELVGDGRSLVGANPGLVFDRFAALWNRNWNVSEGSVETFLTRVHDVYRCKPPQDAEKALETFRERRTKLLKAHGASIFTARTHWRFVSGLGLPNPTENGFVWDRNLGVPYLPGSSVKGMARAWAQYWGAADENTVTRIFGPRGQEKLW
ncbi:MAG: RAMP superfamily CRISPR-associated protein, partial [Armatimonadetes bacterium]|nr:RAMP superfamily CRISPR-associated protein [Armatimonadota bacterium]